MAAFRTSHCLFHILNVLSENLPILFCGPHFFGTVRTHFPDQSLSHQSNQGIGNQIRLHSHVDHTDNRGYCIIRMQGRKDEMSCNSGSDRNRSSLRIPCLPYHDNIRVLSEQRPKPRFKCQSGSVIYLHLIDPCDIFFHRVFDRGNICISLGQIF